MSFGIPVRNGLSVGLLASTFLTPNSGRLVPRLTLNFLAGAPLDSRITFTRSTTATFVGSNGLIQSSAIDAARFDYNPATLAPLGLLIEEQRVNLALQSNGFGTTPWSTGASFTTTANQIISPDGTNNGWKFELTTGAAANLFQTITATSTSCAYSLYVKQGTGPTTANVFGIRNSTTATNLVFIQLNYSTGAFVYTAGSTGATVTNAGNGWWRVQMVVTSGITVGNSLFVYAMSTSGAAGDFAYLYGAQFEAGSFATSYIPTVASTVTRAADAASMTGTNFSSWYDQSQGTFVASYINPVVASGKFPSIYAARIQATNNSQNTSEVFSATASAQNLVRISGADQAVIALGGAFTPGTIRTVAAAYQVNNFAAAYDGILGGTDTNGNVPTALDMLNIGYNSTSDQINSRIRYINYYATRLTNAQLQALST